MVVTTPTYIPARQDHRFYRNRRLWPKQIPIWHVYTRTHRHLLVAALVINQMEIQYHVNQLASNQKSQAGISPPQVKRVHLPKNTYLPSSPTPLSFVSPFDLNWQVLSTYISQPPPIYVAKFSCVSVSRITSIVHGWAIFLSALPGERYSSTFAILQ